MMRYPVAIELGTETTAFGVVVPDLAGCFSAGDTLDEALFNAQEAAAAWIDAVLDAGGPIPGPTTLQDVQASPEFEGWAYGFIDVDPDLLDETREQVEIVLPRRVLKRLDALAAAGGGTRSATVAELTLLRGGVSGAE